MNALEVLTLVLVIFAALTYGGILMKKHMEGHEYEYHCARLLKRKGFSKITVTRASGDQGIDILASKEGRTYGIQCKYYSGPVGNKAVQEAFTGAKFYGCDVAAVLTNSTFTTSARELAQKTDVILWENSTVPRSVGFRVTKWLGVFMCITGLLGFFITDRTGSVKAGNLQQACFLLLAAGGGFNFLEFGSAFMELAACTAYASAAALCVVMGNTGRHGTDNALGIIAAAFVPSLFRAIKLKKK